MGTARRPPSFNRRPETVDHNREGERWIRGFKSGVPDKRSVINLVRVSQSGNYIVHNEPKVYLYPQSINYESHIHVSNVILNR